MFYIEETEKQANKFGSKRTIFELPKWFNKSTLDFIFEKDIQTCVLIELEHAIKIKCHLKFDFNFENYDYILWRKSDVSIDAKRTTNDQLF